MSMKRVWACLILFSAMVSMAWLVSGCGESLKAQVSLETTVTETTTTALMIQDKYLYTVQGDKLVTYNISKPEAPTKEGQQDAFSGPHRAMVPFGTGQMLLVGMDGTIMVFDITTPSVPQPIWGAGKTLKLKYKGDFAIRTNPLVMYITPGDGVAVARVELGELTKADADQAKLDAGTSKIDGGGGGGIYLVRNADNIPVALYVGNPQTGKLDYWSVPDIEAGKAQKPTASIEIQAGTNVSRLFLYQNADNTRGHLVVWASTGEMEFLDLGNEYNSVARPKSVGTATVPDMYLYDMKRKRIFNKALAIYEFDADFKTPALWAKPDAAAVITVNDMVLHPTQDIIYSAESAGFRVYKYAAK